jgi:hypothetical protein
MIAHGRALARAPRASWETTHPMARLLQMNLIASLALVSWLAMQAVHEFGHVVGAWITGGRVERVVLFHTVISRTDLSINPHPLIVVWAGPLLGSLLPLMIWGLAVAFWRRGSYLFRFFAGFCLIANGTYIGIGSFYRIGDAGDMLRYGSPHWQLWLFGIITTVAGLALWNGVGRHFGFSHANGHVSQNASIGSSIALATIVGIELLVHSK